MKDKKIKAVLLLVALICILEIIWCQQFTVRDRIKRIADVYFSYPMMKFQNCINLMNECIFIHSCNTAFLDIATGNCHMHGGDEELYNKETEKERKKASPTAEVEVTTKTMQLLLQHNHQK